MARKAKLEGEVVRKPIKRYYATMLNYSFAVPIVDENGERVPKRNNTGTPIYDGEGNIVYISKSIDFSHLENTAKKGYLSYFDFDPNDTTAQNIVIGERLEQLDNDEGVKVESEQRYESRVNPKAFGEKQARIAIERENENLKNELNDPEALQRRLEELTRPG